ncbi:MAG: AbrB family transcriptional regulator [Pseudolabrys sp.]|nr:AbrB family transcriptional regulator [Pseudolabrys sp.]
MSAPSSSHALKDVRAVAETLVIATIGGVSVGMTGFPGGYISGAIVAVAVAALARRPMKIPVWLTRIIFVLIGISLGSVVTPETLQGMATYPLSIAVLIVAMVVVGYTGALYLRLVHGWDNASAYLAAAPGGMSQVLAIAADVGADIRGVAIVQTLRVVLVAVGLPAGLALLGLAGTSTGSIGGPLNPDMFGELAILVVASSAAAVIAYYFRFPGGLLFGAMVTSAVLHGTGWIHAVMPWWVANMAMIALGAVTGSRFGNMPLRLLLNFVAAAFGSFALALLVVAVFAAGLLSVVSLPVAEVMIAFAPGSVDAMMLLALALHLDPVYVGAHHLTRIFFVSLIMPFVGRSAARELKRPDDKKAAPRDPLPPPTFQD